MGAELFHASCKRVHLKHNLNIPVLQGTHFHTVVSSGAKFYYIIVRYVADPGGRAVYGRSLAGIVGSNSARYM